MGAWLLGSHSSVRYWRPFCSAPLRGTFSPSNRMPVTARRWLSFKDDPERPLTAILTLNTIAHTVVARVGSQVEKAYPGEYALAVASTILTCWSSSFLRSSRKRSVRCTGGGSPELRRGPPLDDLPPCPHSLARSRRRESCPQ